MNKIVLALATSLLLWGCSENTKQPVRDFEQIKASGELTIITLSSSTSYFIYKDEAMGYDYDLAKDFCDFHGLKLNVKVAENSNRLVEMLCRGEGDLVAYPIPVQNELKDSILYCGLEQVSHQVLIQRIDKRDSMVTDVTQLIGEKVYVKHDTKYHQRAQNLNDELGEGIIIEDVLKDTVTVEDLIGMVASQEIDYTVADEYIAKLNKTYYRNIDISLPFSFNQRSSWAVRKESPHLADSLNKWFAENYKKPTYTSIIKKYFEMSKQSEIETGIPKVIIPKGHLTPFDNLFKKHAAVSGLDWYLLAAIGYQESHFYTDRSSWAGAIGLMGLMPRTAKAFGIERAQLTDPEMNLVASTRLLSRLNKMYEKIPDPLERIKFVLAAYNGGNGHIDDARALARKYGDDPDVWYDNVEKYILLKSKSEFYNDPVCKNGYLRGTEVVNYVKSVTGNWEKYKSSGIL